MWRLENPTTGSYNLDGLEKARENRYNDHTQKTVLALQDKEGASLSVASFVYCVITSKEKVITEFPSSASHLTARAA